MRKLPNILITIADDHRGSALEFLGLEAVLTPSLNRLAQRGTTFSAARHLGSLHGAVCAPSRFMLHTGRTYFPFSQHLDFLGVTYPQRTDGSTPPTTLGQVLRQRGYDTFATGKWHNGVELFRNSFSMGENIFFGGMADHFFTPVHPYDPTGRYAAEQARMPDGFSTEVFARSAQRFLESRRNNDKPFFCYVAFTAPHDPRTPPDAWRRRYPPASMVLPPNVSCELPEARWFEDCRDELLLGRPRNLDDLKRAQAEYYGMISHMDQWIGHIHDALDRSGHADDTLVIHTADHGLAVGQHGLLGKQNLFEHSWRVPLIMAGPDVPANTCNPALVYQHDLHPTLLQRVGASHAGDFQSLWDVISGRAGRTEIAGCYRDHLHACCDQRWKLIRSQSPTQTEKRLFDLSSDPHEMRNLADDAACAAHVTRLEQNLHDWIARTGALAPSRQA